MIILIKSCKIVDPFLDYSDANDILIENGIIKQISTCITEKADCIINAEGLTIMPGFIDMHAHLRQPGLEYKETVYTGTQAAAKGGYTTICCMPNTKPVIDDENSLEMLLDIIKKDAVVNVYPIAAISKGQKSGELTDMVKLKQMGAIAFSDDGHPVSNSLTMKNALLMAKQNDFIVIDHCEELNLVNGGVLNEGKAKELNLKGISGLSEELPIMRDIMVAENVDAHIHIAHISTKKSAQIIKQSKENNIKVTCEVTPHHIALSEDIITQGFTDCKVNPPLRTMEDVKAMKNALIDGTIDVIATDHAPHHQDEKGNDFNSAANGISGIETAFSVCYTELVESGLMTINELVKKMSYNPSRILKLNRGRIQEGEVADLVITDLCKEIKINKHEFASKGKNTPFHDRSYRGEIRYTIVNGNIVYSNNKEEI